jgi:hypothetical protein
MEDLLELIKRDIEDDISINTNGIKIEIKRRSIVKRRKTIHIFGSVPSEREKKLVTSIAEHHGGDRYSVLNELVVN